jgi:hypothetical protein
MVTCAYAMDGKHGQRRPRFAGNNTQYRHEDGRAAGNPRHQGHFDAGPGNGTGQATGLALQNYGAYIVDDTGGPNFAINAEDGPDGSIRTQFKNNYNIDIETWNPGGSAWSRDIQRLMQALNVVNNNSASSIGGLPRQPLAPAI